MASELLYPCSGVAALEQEDRVPAVRTTQPRGRPLHGVRSGTPCNAQRRGASAVPAASSQHPGRVLAQSQDGAPEIGLLPHVLGELTVMARSPSSAFWPRLLHWEKLRHKWPYAPRSGLGQALEWRSLMCPFCPHSPGNSPASQAAAVKHLSRLQCARPCLGAWPSL